MRGIGLMALGIYVLLPLFFLSRWMVQRLGKPNPSTRNSPYEKVALKKELRTLSLTVLLLIPMALLGIRTPEISPEAEDPAFAYIHPSGFNRSLTELGILKLEKDSALVYVKPAARFFGSDHNPSICWRASGYAISGEFIAQVEDQEVIMAQLVKEEEVLYTAWWYDNGQEKTISQWKWRWKAATGAPPFRMVNVTALTELQLEHEIQEVIFPYSTSICR